MGREMKAPLRELREGLGKTLEVFSKALGYTLTAYQGVETGRAVITRRMRDALAKIGLSEEEINDIARRQVQYMEMVRQKAIRSVRDALNNRGDINNKNGDMAEVDKIVETGD